MKAGRLLFWVVASEMVSTSAAGVPELFVVHFVVVVSFVYPWLLCVGIGFIYQPQMASASGKSNLHTSI